MSIMAPSGGRPDHDLLPFGDLTAPQADFEFTPMLTLATLVSMASQTSLSTMVMVGSSQEVNNTKTIVFLTGLFSSMSFVNIDKHHLK
jgi:hypothetical protein